MRVKILRNTMADKKAVRVGEIHDISERDARYLIAIKKAEPCLAEESKEEPVAEEAPVAVEIEAPKKKKK